jgi:hypothetical protein
MRASQGLVGMTFTITVHAADGEEFYKAINAHHALSRLRRCRLGEARHIEVVDDATRNALDEATLEALSDDSSSEYSAL